MPSVNAHFVSKCHMIQKPSSHIHHVTDIMKIRRRMYTVLPLLFAGFSQNQPQRVLPYSAAVTGGTCCTLAPVGSGTLLGSHIQQIHLFIPLSTRNVLWKGFLYLLSSSSLSLFVYSHPIYLQPHTGIAFCSDHLCQVTGCYRYYMRVEYHKKTLLSIPEYHT